MTPLPTSTFGMDVKVNCSLTTF